jgi:hypothetical protein
METPEPIETPKPVETPKPIETTKPIETPKAEENHAENFFEQQKQQPLFGGAGWAKAGEDVVVDGQTYHSDHKHQFTPGQGSAAPDRGEYLMVMFLTVAVLILVIYTLTKRAALF